MNYKIQYSCLSHVGKCRSMNEDNFICGGIYMDDIGGPLTFPLSGCLACRYPALLGIFDGMGGEECGEIASLLAAKTASEVSLGKKPLEDLLRLCRDANERICNYASDNRIGSMGTTAAILVFSDNEISLCNIGDSKIFRFADKKLEQISVDHYAVAAYGLKPPLSQSLGIPVSEMVIEPHMARGKYNDGDVYLLCSDGLTDMVSTEDIEQILSEPIPGEAELNAAINKLLKAALDNGGKDNVTIILCRVEKEKRNLFNNIFKLKNKGEKRNGK